MCDRKTSKQKNKTWSILNGLLCWKISHGKSISCLLIIRRERNREIVWLDENLMWVQLLAGPRAPESSEKKLAVKWGAYSGEYSEAIECVFFSSFPVR